MSHRVRCRLLKLGLLTAALGIPFAAAKAADNAEGEPQPMTGAAEAESGDTLPLPAENVEHRPVAETKKLKFSFRYQRWIDVLQWLADKADLSLVIDAPPPGTFNYSDDRQYTPTEAIDLINGVLATKGYTLVRRDRMLTVVNLAAGVPENLVPRIKPEELSDRGDYELVQVQFSLGQRGASEVVAEVKPLLGKYGTAVPLPQTRQLLVTDTAGVLRVVGAVIQSIPQREPEERPKKPEPPEKPLLAVYPLHTADPATALEVLKAMLPGATLALDARAEQINAFATPSQQAMIRGVLEQMQAHVVGDKRPRLEVYRIPDGGGVELARSISALVATAKVSATSSGDQLTAFATPQDQEIIRQAVERVGGHAGGNDLRRIEVYSLAKVDAATVTTSLTALFPRARLTMDRPSRTLIAFATNEEHQALAALIQQLQAGAGDADQRRKLVVYPIHEARRKRLEAALESAAVELPDVKVVKDAEPGQLSIWARPAEHRALAELIAELDQETPDASKLQVSVYSLRSAEPTSTLSILQLLFPTTKFVADAKNRRIMAYASASDQQSIRETLEQMDAGTLEDGQNRLMVYPLGGADVTAALAALKAVAPDATLTSDAKAGTILAWARKVDQQAIAAAIEKLSASPQALSTQVYRLQRGDADAAAKSLATLVPSAKLAGDVVNRSLLVIATQADHARVKTALEQLEQVSGAGMRTQPRTYALAGVDGAALLATLTAFFGQRPEVRFSLDATNHKLLALATPEQHDTIRKIIDDAQSESDAASTARLEVLSLDGADPATAKSMLGKLVAKLNPPVDLSVDATAKQVVVLAEPAQHEQIREALRQLQGAETSLEVLQLEVLDPAAATTAIGSLFGNDAGAPKVGSDAASGQIFVRGTADQLHRVRELLLKMGEVSLARDRHAVAGRKLRMLGVGGDARAALREIQQIWPKLRGNALEVVTPSAIAPLLQQQSRERRDEASPPRDSPPKLPDAPRPHDASGVSRAGRPIVLVSQSSDTAPEAPLPDAAPPRAPDDAAPPAGEEPSPPQPAPRAAELPPVLVAPSGDGLLIASEDVEALDQLESLIRALSRRGTGSGNSRDFLVVPLKIASASSVAESLDRLFRGLGGRLGASPMVVVADPRLNAVIVHASRSDRPAVERLIETLDSPNLPDSLLANKPQILPIKNTKATAIEKVLRNVYATQLTSGGGRAPVPVPAGISSEMANIIRQVNAAVSGPQMSLSVDEITNSLVIMAATPLVAEVTRLVESLDTAAAHDAAHAVEIVPLHKTNVKVVEKALDTLLKENGRRRARDTRSP